MTLRLYKARSQDAAQRCGHSLKVVGACVHEALVYRILFCNIGVPKIFCGPVPRLSIGFMRAVASMAAPQMGVSALREGVGSELLQPSGPRAAPPIDKRGTPFLSAAVGEPRSRYLSHFCFVLGCS